MQKTLTECEESIRQRNFFSKEKYRVRTFKGNCIVVRVTKKGTGRQMMSRVVFVKNKYNATETKDLKG